MKKIILLSLIIFLISIKVTPQELSKITITEGDKSYLISALNKNGDTFILLNELLDVLQIKYSLENNSKELKGFLKDIRLLFTVDNPFIIKKNIASQEVQAIQFSKPPVKEDGHIFVPISETVELFNSLIERILVQVSPTKLQVLNRNQLQYFDDKKETSEVKNFITLKIKEENEKSVIKISSSNKAPVFSNFFRDNNLHLILWDVILAKDSVIESKSSPHIKKIEVYPYAEYTELVFHLTIDDILAYYEKGSDDSEFSIHISKKEYGKWYVIESKNFVCIYRDSHSHLVNHILASAENALKVISKLFNYTPSEKIVINTYDASDYGFGGTIAIPLNFIRLEIEPIEPGYEVVPYNERFQWLLSHELIHIAVNDDASDVEKFLRSVFGKVNPEKYRPVTIPFSLLTGSNRYTPRWHQEAPAVYMETWLSGGFGRVLGNFDEMYFRSLVVEDQKFPDDIYLDGILGYENFLIETLYYIYGGRFTTHLAIKYGNEKIFNWFATDDSEFYPSFKGKFRKIFGKSFSDEWNDFIREEKEFQQKNIELLRLAPLTPVRYLSKENFGFVTEPSFSKRFNSLIFGYHRSHELATLKMFNLTDFSSDKLASLPTPSAIRVASTAYDDSLGLIFYTTNNNQLYRDLRIYDIEKDEDRLLFKDCRTGHLTISPRKHELWGIQHNSGKAILVKSRFPFDVLETMVVFETGDEIQQLAINNSGDFLAAVIHRATGQQSIVISDVTKLDEGGKFQFNTLTSAGSPENPSWSDDDRYLFWNAYTNGVSNIYRCDLETGEISAVTHTLIGLFKPLYISKDSLSAFEFTSEGMKPVMIANSRAQRLPAINYLGQKVLDTNPEVIEWALPNASETTDKAEFTREKEFNSFNYLKIQTFIPILSGFQKSKVLGFYSHIADPILNNEFSIEAGISPFKEMLDKVRWHLKIKYDIKQTYYFAIEHNPTDFYDLFNKRKRGTLGNRFSVGHNDYWVYDNPLKIKQTTELSYYTDTKFINDNLVEVSEPDFYVFKTEFEYKDLRRTIGSFDFEHGNHFRINIIGFGADLEKFEVAPAIYLEWDNYSLYFFDHNVLRLKFAAGYHHLNENILQAQFFFGGFGNREIENEPVRQYEKVFRFPGIPIYSIPTDNFIKVMFSNIFPPLRFNSPEILGQYIKNINLSVFSQGLITDLPKANKWIDAGAQLNIIFNHWYNLESTLSGGVAKAWWKGGNDWEWFVSYKLLRD